jgi:biotin carboxylase
MSEFWLIAVTAGRWQLHGIRKAKAMGLKVVAIDADENAEGFKEADYVINLPLNEVDKILAALADMKVVLRGVVSFASDAGVPLAGEIRERFSLPGARKEICCRLTNKAVQRRLWAQHGVPGPRVKVVETTQAALAAIDSFGFPLIIKPADSSGSRGVSKLESPQDDLADAVARAFQFSRSGQVLLEDYMQGTEFTVETFSVRGMHYVLAVTEKKKVEGTRGTVARELATPQRSPGVIDRISSAVVSAFTALGYEDGPGHAEVILMNNGSVGLVEVAGRGGGFQVFDRMVPAISGIDIAQCTVMQAVGMDIEPIESRKHAAVLRFLPSRPGTVVAIRGFAEANEIEGVEASSISSVGDSFGTAAADGDRLGWILSQGETPEIAQQRADLAEAHIFFDVL